MGGEKPATSYQETAVESKRETGKWIGNTQKVARRDFESGGFFGLGPWLRRKVSQLFLSLSELAGFNPNI